MADGSVQFRYGSVCSGIEAASAAWHPLGWRASFLSEIEPFPRAVLEHHYPDVPCHGDFTTIQAGDYEPIDLLVGGTPCQDFSIAGKRAGLDGERGNLTLEFARLANRLRARWLVWENVPGVFSNNEGRDFGAVLACFSGNATGTIFDTPKGGWQNSGVVPSANPDSYGLAWRVLDAQFAGVPQRRRRVFVVGYLGDWRRAAAVLFERQSLQGNPPPRRQAGEGFAVGTLAGTSPGGGWRVGADEAAQEQLINCTPAGIAGTMSSKWSKGTGGPAGDEHYNLITHSLRAEGFDASEDGTGRGTPLIPIAFSIMPQNSGKDYKARAVEVSQPLMAGGPVGGNQGGDFIAQAAAFAENSRAELRFEGGDGSRVGALSAGGGKPGQGIPMIAFDCKASGQNGFGVGEIASTMRAMGHAESHTNGGGHQAAMVGSAVRRLTPRECERLQGFEDDYTLIHFRGKPAADGPRYKALRQFDGSSRDALDWKAHCAARRSIARNRTAEGRMTAICPACHWNGSSAQVRDGGRCPECGEPIRYDSKPLQAAPKLDAGEFNRRALIALNGVTFAPHSSTASVLDSFRMLHDRGEVSAKMQQAIYNIVHRYRRQITDQAVLEFALLHAKGAD